MAGFGAAEPGKELLAQFEAEKAGMYSFRLYPELWKTAELGAYYNGRAWNSVKFAEPPPDIPTTSGIYMFVVGPYCGGIQDHSYIFYVGKAKNLRTRYGDYLNEKAGKVASPRKLVMTFLNNFEGFTYFHYTLVPEDELASAEALLKDNLTPHANTQIDIIGRLRTK